MRLALLEAALLKENIDGEALLGCWARYNGPARRMLTLSQTAQLLTRQPWKQIPRRYSGSTFAEVIRWIDQTPIDLAALALSTLLHHYRNSVQIDALSDLGLAMIDLLDRGLAEKRA